MPNYLLSVETQEKIAFICCAVRRTKTKDDARKAAIGAAIAVGALPPELSGQSITDISGMMDLTRAAISKKAKSYCAKFALPPSHYMKAPDAGQSFRNARLGFLKAHQRQVA